MARAGIHQQTQLLWCRTITETYAGDFSKGYARKPGAAMTCPSRFEGAWRRRTSAMVHRAALLSYGKNLVDDGVPPDRVAQLLGHESVDTTRIYTTPSEQDLQREVVKVAYS